MPQTREPAFQAGDGRPHHLFFTKRDGAAWRYQRKIAGARKLVGLPEAEMRPGTLPGLLRAPSLSKEGSRGPFGFVWGDELLCPWRVLSWTAPAARSLFVRKENGGLGSTPLGGGKKRGLWPQSQAAPAEPGHKNPPLPPGRGGKEKKKRGGVIWRRCTRCRNRRRSRWWCSRCPRRSCRYRHSRGQRKSHRDCSS